MNQTETRPDDTADARATRRKARRGQRLRRAGVALLVLLLVVVLLLGLLYLNRRAAARQVLVGWLDQRGIQADVEVERIELNGFVGRIRIGDPRNPDVRVERVEVDYALAAPWSRTGMGVTPSRIRLVRPFLHASWKDGKLSLGALDPLVEEFTGGPPRPDSRSPVVIVEGGQARVDTEYGPIRLLADARLDDGKLMRLSGHATAEALKSADVEAAGVSARVNLTTRGDRVQVRIDGEATAFDAAGLNGETAALLLTGDLPYPDMKTRRGNGRATLEAHLTGAVLGVGETRARGADVKARFDGTTAGWIETFRIRGETTVDLTANQLTGPDLAVQSVQAQARSGELAVSRSEDGVQWTLDTPLLLQAGQGRMGELQGQNLTVRANALKAGGMGGAFEVEGALAASAAAAGFGELVLRQARSDLSLDIVQDGATRVVVEGNLRAEDGAWPLFGPTQADDLPDLAAMKQALGSFGLNVPAVRLSTGSGGTVVQLNQPATLTPRNGGVLTVSQGTAGAFRAEPGRNGGGALNLTATRGQGLPELAIAIPEWRLTDAGFEAQLDGTAGLDFDLARGLRVRTRGQLAMANGLLTYVPGECVDLTVQQLELGENDVHDLAGQLCPAGQPLFSSREGVWSLVADFRDVTAAMPPLAVGVSDGFGRLVVNGTKAGVGMLASVSGAEVADTTDPRRFNPMNVSGKVQLKNESWDGGFTLRGTGAAAAYTLGNLTLAHNGASGAGGIFISVPDVAFREGGLQPSMLSPLVEGFVSSPVTGSVGFEGRFDWTKDADATSSGRLTVPGLDFTSPAGPVKGLRGSIDFTSLTPLVSAPEQRLHIDSLAVGTDLTALDLVFTLDDAGLNVSSASLQAAEGVVSIEPVTIPLTGEWTRFNGVIVLDRLQLNEVIADTGLSDKVSLDAVVSGRLPFSIDAKEGLKIIGGSLHAVQPGRLSIKREVLTDVEAQGAGEEVPTNTVQDLAYQAMEHLAFDILTADVNSVSDGRVDILFHVRGRHSPPKRQELKVTVMDLITRRFLNQELPLPSGTGIDLTLDTTFNANQLVSDLLALNRAREGRMEDAP